MKDSRKHWQDIVHYLRQLPGQRLIIFGAIFWVLIATFQEIAEEILEGEPLPGDNAILRWIYQLASPELTDAMLAVTATGGFIAVPVLMVIFAAGFWYYHRRAKAVILLVTITTLAAMNLVLKLLFERPRPDLRPELVDTSTFAFPSGHAMLSSALAFTLVALLWHSRWRWLVVMFAAVYVSAVGFSRLYLGVHYPTDVIAGWCISGAWVVLVLAVLRGRAFFAARRNQ